MTPGIEHWNEARDGPVSEAAMRARLEAEGYRVSRYDYPPGTCFPPHSHGVDKIDGVLVGCLRITMEGREWVLGPGDRIRVPRGVRHSAEVVGDQVVVSLDAVLSGP